MMYIIYTYIKIKDIMEENVMEDVQKDYPKYYWLFSITMVIDGKRKFLDIPVYSHKMIFPNRNVIYSFACAQVGVSPESQDIYSSFAVIGVFQFSSKEDYESYTSVPEDEPVHEEIAEE